MATLVPASGVVVWGVSASRQAVVQKCLFLHVEVPITNTSGAGEVTIGLPAGCVLKIDVRFSG